MGLFTGLQTLKIKETDRIEALIKELAKVNVSLARAPERFSKKSGVEYHMLEGTAVDQGSPPEFNTYNDHRMAMCLAPLAVSFPVVIHDPEVVSKSYPGFWKDLASLGFEIKET
jgi:3-phosphoshikimate 1-carboxyvinyltransferase